MLRLMKKISKLFNYAGKCCKNTNKMSIFH